jgi:cytochrome o ubiquinol oxidase subunit 2
MKKKFLIAAVSGLFLVLVFAAIVFFRTHNVAVLNPKGMIALQQRDLIFTASWLMLIVVLPVFILTIVFCWKYREKNKGAKYTPDWAHSYTAEVFWWGIPCVIVAILAVMTWKSSHALNPYKPIVTEKKPLVIQVVALDWKWLFLYPEQGIATVNWVQFPVGTPLNFEITADAPMNSFWIPQLGGQIYAMPAMRTQLHLIANEAGDFRGCSSNISGVGFAGMAFTASSQEEFDQWVSSAKQSSEVLNLDLYHQLVQPSQYNPVVFYRLAQGNLFDQIIMQYSVPEQ